MRRHIHHIHILILAALLLFAVVLLLGNILIEKAYLSKPVFWGVSFSPKYARQLSLDPKQVYSSILDLGVRYVRLSANWDEIEPQKGHFEFTDLDWYVQQSQKKGTKVILGVGYKLPRWPECRAPKWLDPDRHPELACTERSECVSGSYLRERQLIMVEEVIKHFDQSPTVSAYQLENEPLLDFGVCPPIDRKFLSEEVEFVRKLTGKPIIITDAGELRPWRTPMKESDIFGTTLYRKVHNSLFGDFYYPIPAWHYRLKSDLVRRIFAPNNQKTIIVELQAEPWVPKSIDEIPISSQVESFSLNQLKETVQYAKRTGIDEIYFWGVEWWYYLARNGHPEYLEYAKGLF